MEEKYAETYSEEMHEENINELCYYGEKKWDVM